MPTRKELIDELEKELENLVELSEEEKQNKVKRRQLAALLFALVVAYNEDRFTIGTVAVLNKARIRRLVANKDIKKEFDKLLKRRKRKINYTRMVRRQSNIYNNQLKREGVKTATKKLKTRVSNILETEGNNFRDRGKIFGGKIVNKTTNKVVIKQWVWAMYGTPKEARDSHQAADGQRVPIDQPFIVGGKRVNAPRQFNDPSEDINCHCGVKIELF